MGVLKESALQKILSIIKDNDLSNILLSVKDQLISHTSNKSNPHKVTKSQVGLGNVDNTSDNNKPVSTAQQQALDDLYQQLTEYTRQKIADLINGASTTMDTLAEIEKAMTDHKAVVAALDAAVGKKANAAEFDSHVKDNTKHVTSAILNNLSGLTSNIQTQINSLKTSISGKAASKHTHAKADITDFPTIPTYSNFVKSGSGAKAGLVPSPGTTAGTTKYLREDGTWQKPPNNTYSNMKGATSSAAGSSGLVPAPSANMQNYFLNGAGIWENPFELKTKAVSSSITYNGKDVVFIYNKFMCRIYINGLKPLSHGLHDVCNLPSELVPKYSMYYDYGWGIYQLRFHVLTGGKLSVYSYYEEGTRDYANAGVMIFYFL